MARIVNGSRNLTILMLSSIMERLYLSGHRLVIRTVWELTSFSSLKKRLHG